MEFLLNHKQLSLLDVWSAVRFHLSSGSKNSHKIIRDLADQNKKIQLLQDIVEALTDLPKLRELAKKIPTKF